MIKTKSRLIFTIAACLILVYPTLLTTKLVNGTFSLIKQTGCTTNISQSIKASKQNGFFVAEYTPAEKFITLNDDSKVTNPKAWIESNWCHSYDWLLNRTKSKSDEYKFLIEFKFELDETPTFSLQDSEKQLFYYSSRPLGAFVLPFKSIKDTFMIFVLHQSKNNRKQISVVDSIEFTRVIPQ